MERLEKQKIIVLDDDPTGVQTVHGIHVYTDWEEESIRAGFAEKENVFYILTNSRGLTVSETSRIHREIASRVCRVAKSAGQQFLIISRSDSTLRGHYPLETDILREVCESEGGIHFDGDILCPCFFEGGRTTKGDIHYVKSPEGEMPAAETEFAKDITFGYHSSNLKEYIAEKSGGACPADQVISFSLEELRGAREDGEIYQKIRNKLLDIRGGQKIIVNAENYADLDVFTELLREGLQEGRQYMIRSAASFVKSIGEFPDRPYLTGHQMRVDNGNGGIIVIGSHTKKTTGQLEQLRHIEGIEFLELDSDLVLEEGALERETERIVQLASEKLAGGTTVCVSTKRKLLQVEGDTPEAALVRSVKISTALQRCVGELTAAPSFVVAKGGITSADVGVKALGVKCAEVLGQADAGIPVWRTGAESRFPGIPYVIFPGNVGTEDTLRQVAGRLMFPDQDNWGR